MRTLTARGWGTVAAFAVLAAVVIATVLAAPTGARRPTTVASQIVESNAAERCRDLGLAAETDPGCHALRREQVRRFLGEEGGSGHE